MARSIPAAYREVRWGSIVGESEAASQEAVRWTREAPPSVRVSYASLYQAHRKMWLHKKRDFSVYEKDWLNIQREKHLTTFKKSGGMENTHRFTQNWTDQNGSHSTEHSQRDCSGKLWNGGEEAEVGPPWV